MTNAEKYKEIFGFEPDKSACPTDKCVNCPRSVVTPGNNCICNDIDTPNWWEEDYKEIKER